MQSHPLRKTRAKEDYPFMKTVIGICPLWDETKDSLWMFPGYMNMLEEQGVVPLMMPLTTDTGILDYFLSACGGFLLTGGQDVSPSLYGASPSEKCGLPCPERDAMDAYILKEAIRLDRSVLGICRGIQLMNAALGGTLYQDIPTEHPGGPEHHMSAPYDRVAHFVEIRRDTPLSSVLGVERLGVNSYHHQAVRELAPSLTTTAVSEDGLIEGVCMPGKRFIWGLQWHPELSYKSDPMSRKIAAAFVESAR